MRGKIINLNKINKILKVVCKYFNENIIISVGSYNRSISTITLNNKTILDWELGEDLITMLKKENINWKLSFKDNNMIINIW